MLGGGLAQKYLSAAMLSVVLMTGVDVLIACFVLGLRGIKRIKEILKRYSILTFLYNVGFLREFMN